MAENNGFTHLPSHCYFKESRNYVVAVQYLRRQRGILLIELLTVAM